MKFKFDAKLDYQLDAISSVVDLFEGFPSAGSLTNIDLGSHEYMGVQQNELGIGHGEITNPDAVLANLHKIQEQNFIDKSKQLIAPDDEYSFPNFSVEMETGTGKTYVFLRTIFELNKAYGCLLYTSPSPRD